MSDSAKWVVDLAARISWAWGFQEPLIRGKSTETGCWKYKVPPVINPGIFCCCCCCCLEHFCFSYGKILNLASLHRTFVDILVIFLPKNTVKMSCMPHLLHVLLGVLSFFKYQMIPSLKLMDFLSSTKAFTICVRYFKSVHECVCTYMYMLLEETPRIIMICLHLAWKC